MSPPCDNGEEPAKAGGTRDALGALAEPCQRVRHSRCAAQAAEHSTLLPGAAPGRLHPNPRYPARSSEARRCLPRTPQVLLVENDPAELGKARALLGSQLPHGSHLPRAWRRKRASRTPPPFRSAPQAALPREEPSARSVLNKNQVVSPLRARARRKALSRGARSSPPPVPIASPRGPAGPACLGPLPHACPGPGFGAGGGGPHPSAGQGPGSGRVLPAGAAARQPGAAARAGLRCAGGAGFFVGCRVTGSH
ncbi:POLG alternative reading frame-like [Vidua macroura]|uniref:POLG alternative reading frame-like n=1 Tax=Vidua macroura TaxID=187451 RepID=UPI0023A8B5DC|nr:POLG alternative reading frame-like [Vidua macroura]